MGIEKYQREYDGERRYISAAELYAEMLEEYGDKISDAYYIVDNLYINTRGYYGPQGVACCGATRINLPKYMTPIIEAMLKDDEMMSDIRNELVGIKAVPYEKEITRGKGKAAKTSTETFYSIKWVDLRQELPF